MLPPLQEEGKTWRSGRCGAARPRMGSSEPQLVYLRDLADVEPPRDRYPHYDEEDIYRLVPRPQWTGLEDEIWTPRSQEHDPQLEKVKALMKRNQQGGAGDNSARDNAFSATKFATKLARKKRKNPKIKVRQFLNNRWIEALVNTLILWALFMEDIRILSIPKEADVLIWWAHVFVMWVFTMEIVLRSYSQVRAGMKLCAAPEALRRARSSAPRQSDPREP